MTDIVADKKNIRKPSTALVLSLIMPGLGHIYCGRFIKGLILAFLSGILTPVFFVASLIDLSFLRMTVIVLIFLWSLVIGLIATIDSWYTAKHTSQNYMLKEYNRWYVYVILILMGTSTGISSTGEIALKIKNVAEAFRCVGVINYPNIVPNDRVLMNKLAYKKSDPKIGDLVIFMNPENRHQNFIKRVVAVAGDTVEIKDNQLYINDQQLERQELPQPSLNKMKIKDDGTTLEGDVYREINGNAEYKIFIEKQSNDKSSRNFAKITIPANHYFVLSDNRNQSKDSRQFGPISIETIKGRVDFLYWPAKDWSRFGRINN